MIRSIEIQAKTLEVSCQFDELGYLSSSILEVGSVFDAIQNCGYMTWSAIHQLIDERLRSRTPHVPGRHRLTNRRPTTRSKKLKGCLDTRVVIATRPMPVR